MRWTLKAAPPNEAINILSGSLNHLSPVLASILLQRGIDSFEKAKDFFRADLAKLHDPFLMKDMDLAVDRLLAAIRNDERILIFGDYDVDGTTAVALVYSYLSEYYDGLDYYIPDRYAEGYGVSLQGIDYAADNEISLIIALDCGIKAMDKVQYAKEKGIDFIICDHHQPGETLPQAVAVLDPKRKDCNYPYTELSGCGIGFKFMQAFAKQQDLAIEVLYQYLDLLAVSICADIVPITGENRILTYYGIKKLNQRPLPGLKAMIEVADHRKKELNVTDVVFTIAPRINAAGRIESGQKAVEVLISDQPHLARDASEDLDLHNKNRRQLDKEITQEALSLVEKMPADRKSTVVYKADWHKGVIGIVASRLIEHHYRPTIVLTESNGKASGSARSVKGFNVYHAIEACSELLEQFGGHKYAAGMTMQVDQIPAFQEKFEAVVAASITEEQLVPEIEIDAPISLSEINDKFYKVLKQLAPFGPGNMRPVFMAKTLLAKNARIVGKDHLKLDVYQIGQADIIFPAIAFGLAKHYDFVQSNQPFDLAFVIEENEWKGTVSLQLVVKAIRPSSD